MPSPQPAPLTELAAARDPSRVSALWALAHPLGPCAGDPAPAVEDCRGIEEAGELLALGAVRSWGRVGCVHGFAVSERAKGRGFGEALLRELVRELERRDCAVIGLELERAEDDALATLAAAGFKPGPPCFILDSLIGEATPDAPEMALLSGASAAEHAGLARLVASSVDAHLDPSAWLAARLQRGEAEAIVVGPQSAPRALAVLPSTGGGDALAVSMLLCAEGPPKDAVDEVLRGLVALARDRSLSRIQLAAPSRYWDATSALLARGFRPLATSLRFTRTGYPESADVGRTCLMTLR